jgi:23S rRNA pseudouridine1911/1915/1917 synthase
MSLNDGYVYRERLGSHPGKTALEYLANKYRHSSGAEWEERFALKCRR